MPYCNNERTQNMHCGEIILTKCNMNAQCQCVSNQERERESSVPGKHLEIESAKIVSHDYHGLDIEALYLTSFLFIAIHSKQL